ncbi:hypothetical protein F4679DRAFT_13151 [Xylaria curta]|nr:hypothetical protein F4679DRAFT_13151 [Xylaria curta]
MFGRKRVRRSRPTYLPATLCSSRASLKFAFTRLVVWSSHGMKRTPRELVDTRSRLCLGCAHTDLSYVPSDSHLFAVSVLPYTCLELKYLGADLKMAATDWRNANVEALEKTKIIDAVNQNENIGNEILKVIGELKKELKAVLAELEAARAKVVTNNTTFLAALNKLPKNDQSETIRNWANAD